MRDDQHVAGLQTLGRFAGQPRPATTARHDME
jgi:hypothetical protein